MKEASRPSDIDTFGDYIVAGVAEKKNDIQMENMHFETLMDTLIYLIPHWSVYHFLYLLLLFTKHLFVIYIYSIKPHNNHMKYYFHFIGWVTQKG